MAIDHLEVLRMEIRDFGEPITVLPAQAAAFVAMMIFDDAVDEARIGHVGGHMGQPTFRCLPEVDGLIAVGTRITLDGVEYKVFEVVRRRHCLTEILVKEQ